jgi:hypothetical protein
MNNKTPQKEEKSQKPSEKEIHKNNINHNQMLLDSSSDDDDTIYCMDFTNGVRDPTDQYDALSDSVNKARSVLDSSDLAKIEKLIAEAPQLFHLETDQLPLSTFAWTSIFIEAEKITSRKSAKYRYKSLGIALAGTNPETILPRSAFDGYRVK